MLNKMKKLISICLVVTMATVIYSPISFETNVFFELGISKYLDNRILILSFNLWWNVVGFQTNLYLFAVASNFVPSKNTSSMHILKCFIVAEIIW